MGLVTHEQLCKVVWGIIIKNFMQRQTERERERERERQTDRQTDRQIDR